MKYRILMVCVCVFAAAFLYTQDDFIIPKKTITSLNGLKQDSAQESIYLLGDYAHLLASISGAQIYCINVAADLINGSGAGAWKKPTKTQLEKYTAHAQKIRKQIQELNSSLKELQSIVS